MPPVPETSAPPADPAVANDYDSFAEAYSAETEANLINGYYARPAILALAGDVAGRRILDAGCGSGPLFAALRDRGAIVTGFDSSTAMLELARRRLGVGADLLVADLGSPLPFPDGAFDDVIASLVLHYLEDWTAPLAELRRVLTPGGRLIVAVDHPFAIHGIQRLAGRKTDYFATYNWTEEWTFGGQSALDELLEPAAARDDRCLHRGWLSDLRHQRTTARAGRPRAVPRRLRGQAELPVLSVLRPGGQLTAARRRPPVLISPGRQPRPLLLQRMVPGDDAAVTLGQSWIVASMVRWRDWLMFADLAPCPIGQV